jgi:uncharacterized membrane protein HdeD (DUF308 family)
MPTDNHDRSSISRPLARARFARSLSILYFARTAVSLTWVLAISAFAATMGPASSLGFRVWTLLVLYPLTDAAATVIDINTTPRESQTHLQRLNLATSLAAAGAVAATVNGNFATTLAVFGIWAIASGAIQLVVALRRTTLASAQWFMIISGAGSIFAGTTYLRWHGTAHDGVTTLAQYSTGGAIWYAIVAIWLFAASHRHTGRNPSTPPSPFTVDAIEVEASKLATATEP